MPKSGQTRAAGRGEVRKVVWSVRLGGLGRPLGSGVVVEDLGEQAGQFVALGR